MADHEDEDLKMALRLSMQHSPPEPKRSKPRDAAGASSPEDSRRLQRELMAAAAEKRLLAARSAGASSPTPSPSPSPVSTPNNEKPKPLSRREGQFGVEDGRTGRELSSEEAYQLFSMVFGGDVSKGILAQWSNQGIRFSPDPETSMGLVQHEGGPCGVLAAVQAFVLKCLLFFPDDLRKGASTISPILGPKASPRRQFQGSDNFSSLSDSEKLRALIRSMSEILFHCGSNKRAVIATLSVTGKELEVPADGSKDEGTIKALEGLPIESASDLQKILRVETYSVQATVFRRLEATLPFFQSRMGALLFLISALLSRGLDAVQADRDDPSLPLVTAPFGHASQEIVNLLLCGQAVPNVFDGRMDLGGGMFLKGVSTCVEVGFLTLLESLNFCKVGQHLKCPNWPIWVVGSESHYTVLFALDTIVQEENELEERESQIRRAFDAQDQSGGGGFIGVEGFHQVLRETDVRLPPEKVDQLCSSGFIVWSEFWQAILDLDSSMGGLKDSSGLMGKKVFDLYHFNGIAKSDLNGQANSGSEAPVQRPRLTKLRVSVPPRWTPEEFMAAAPSGSGGDQSSSRDAEVAKPEPPQHAPLVDCIRTRWPRAVCNWVGDPPSIV
ncbi:ubiquitin carboxyl-terminal hydrolase MINDY-3 isoform X2 [Rhodamnia argentea]|uniref:ubiquitinyl hydrolase 1 n=1 Tax=Rhodamnia argentea TaxID=178133 RepID=A0A8B8QA86_9MYRT|nr:ubiquitin carboxyl-terminal hydrolase MINDY-3 isoform X2 [Rhodamnia argentea]